MKKLFVKFLMMLFVLGMSTTAWAGGSFDPSQLPPEMLQTLLSPTYCAKLTGHASSTGGGKVYVNAPQAGQSASDDPRGTEYVEGTSNVAVSGMGMSMAGMTKIGINAWAKADPGYWFAGFSYSNMGTDLGTANPPQGEEGYMPGLYASTYDIGIQENETIEHVIYGTFEPIRFAGYEITGNTTTSDDGNGNRVCNLAVIFTPSGAEEDIDASDFKAPAVSGDGWSLVNWDYNTSNAGKVTVNVRFTTTSTEVAEYAGSLKLETQATPAISMNVPLNVRTAASSNIEAIRYDKNKEKQGEGTLADMIAAASPTDVIKLNKNHNSAVTINKSFTLDLNGYDMIVNGTALTITNNATLTLAYSPYNDTDHGRIIGINQDGQCIYVESGSKLILNGTSIFNANNAIVVAAGAELVQNGANIAGANNAIYSQGTVTTTDGNVKGRVCSVGSDANLTINGGAFDNMQETINAVLFQTGVAIQVDGGTALIKKGNIIGQSYGVQSAGTTTIEKLAVIRGGTESKALNVIGGKTTVKCGKFADPSVLSNVDGGVFEFQSAYFQEDNMGVEDVEGKKLWRNTSGTEYREGYVLFAGDLAAAQAAGVSVCHIGGTSYTKLEDAFAFANNTSEEVVIIMDNDYILPAGYYTIPSNATLLIPMSNEQGAATAIVNRDRTYTTPSLFRKLTLANGVNIDVFGTIEVSGTQYSGDSNQEEGSHTGAVRGDYAQLQMNKGSKITMQNGSVLRAWGYVTGDIEHKDAQHNVPMGEIDVRRGATVYELFQLGDWGNTVMNGLGLVSGDSRFPITSYFIQNVEVPTKYHPGGRLTSVTTVSASGGGLNLTMCANDIQIIGVTGVDVAMFLMNQEADAENTWVRKWYDASKDQQVYEINSAAHIGNLVINLASSPLFEGLETTLAGMQGTWQNIGNLAQNMGAEFHQDLVMNSGQYVLPITSNFKLHLLSGTLDFTQSTELIPGSELEIDKEATVSVTDRHLNGVREGSLYIYDWRDWSSSAANGQPAQKILYTPAFDDGVNNGVVPDAVRDVSTCEALGHAKVNVHGTFDTYQGYIFTSENGGDIFSHVEDAGTFMFTSPALLNEAGTDSIEVVKLTTSFGGGGETVNFYPAKLHNSAAYVANGGDEYKSTGGTKAGQSYCYSNFDGNGARWTMLEQRGCFTYDGANDTYYIKPQEYVAVAVNAEWDETEGDFISLSGNDDNTFSDAAGAGRLFILLTDENGGNCQWWEVEQKNNYYHCIHPDNDTYYYWDETEKIWKEVKFTITWKDKNWENNPTEDVVLQSYSVPYGTQAEWLSTNPTRPASVDYTYDFTGWSPALDKVTSDVTYTATYEEKQIKYTITFVQDGGMEIERHLLARNEMPVCENVPTRTGYVLEWSPALAAVTGNQTYTATWLPEPPEKYEIKFMDYNGTTELKIDSVEVGKVPTPPTNPTSKPETPEYTYVFDHWSPALEEVSATSAKVYTAVYREVAREYTIYYFKEDGVTPNATKASESLPYGATPTPPAVSKENPAEGNTYTYVWKDTADASKTIETVTAAASYKPVFTGTKNKYTVTLQCNLPGKCSFTGAGIYEHNTYATISATPVDGYEFVKWQERSGDANLGSVAVTDNISLTAVVKESAKPAPGNLNLGVDADPVTISSATDYMDLSITSNGIDASSQIVNANNITLYGNADFVFKQNIKAGYWYSFAVPWRVDATSGVYLGGSSTPAVLGKDFEIIYYDGAVRAAQGKVDACWVYLKNLSTKKVLEPGRAYMIFIKHGSQSQIVFRKKVQEPLLTTTTTINQYSAASDLDANWNAIANPALYKAYMYAGADPKGFYYKSEDDLFDWYHLKDEKLVVGEAVYIQAPNAEPIVANASSYAAAAPRRERAEQATSFDVQIAAAGAAKRADHISVQIDENKEENKYIIGKDLTKFGVSARVAQMWINRYDVKLCFNTIAPEGESTFFPMSIYAPKAGAYTIAIEREVATEDYNLYLTYNGEAIWNLSDGAYTANLNKGTDANYGLRISAKAPQTATGMDEAVVDSKDAAAYKVLIGNQVFIIRGEKVYSMDGQLVK